MTAGQDEARAREIVREWAERPDIGIAKYRQEGLIATVAAALSEARDRGARDRDAQIIEACRQKGNGGVPFITELTAKLPLPSAAPDIFAESAKNTQALAPLREAVVTAAVAYAEKWGHFADDLEDPDAPEFRALARACAALSSAQGSTTEGRDG